MCDQVTERVALGESLGELAEHAAACPTCQRLAVVSRQLGQLGRLGRLGVMHHEVDPGLGFSARMTIGAQHRIAVRRRRKLAAGFAATVATGAFGVFLVTRTPDVTPPPAHEPTMSQPAKSPEPDSPTAATDADLATLVQLADVDRSSRISAKWPRIKKPLAPYKKLLKGVTP
jgi:hypothetical protein